MLLHDCMVGIFAPAKKTAKIMQHT